MVAMGEWNKAGLPLVKRCAENETVVPRLRPFLQGVASAVVMEELVQRVQLVCDIFRCLQSRAQLVP